MLRLVTERKKLVRARNMLASAIRVGADRSVLTLSTPGGQIPGAHIFYRDDLDIWSHVATKLWNENRYFCGFGSGRPNWQPAIEINIPVGRHMNCNGQVVENDDGDMFLAHKGGLGGGRYSVAAAPFADVIQGFEREEVRDGERQMRVFVLGRLEADHLPDRLADYVREAVRIRQLRRELPAFRAALTAVGVPDQGAAAYGTHEYVPENDADGHYTIARQVAFQRLHGKVQKALATELRAMGHSVGTKRLKGNIAPDLFLQDASGRPTVTFEIKIAPGAQSFFTALGQLIVYTIGEDIVPRRVLVSKAIPTNPLFLKAMEETGVEHVRYEMRHDRVAFPDLGSVVAS